MHSKQHYIKLSPLGELESFSSFLGTIYITIRYILHDPSLESKDSDFWVFSSSMRRALLTKLSSPLAKARSNGRSTNGESTTKNLPTPKGDSNASTKIPGAVSKSGDLSYTGFTGLPDSASQLCEKCAAIDWEELFGRDISREGLYLMDFDQLNKTCPLCRMVKAIVAWPKGLDLYAYNSRQAFGNPLHSQQAADTKLLGFRPKGTSEGSIPKWLFSLQKAQSEQEEFFAVRFLRSDRFDFGLAQQWLEHCLTYHVGTCSSVRNETFQALRMIDCESMPWKVVQAPRNCKYAALSYVWGSKEATHHSESREQGDVLRTLPKTITDSIAVTTALSIRYLWVDRYCIDQSDTLDKAIQIQQMDSIYAGAQVTIIAAAGKGPDHGLPGVNGTVREGAAQHAIRVGPFAIVSVPTDGKQLQRSKWATRAWTYQEGVLSKRRLIFTDKGVDYDCCGMRFIESVNMPLETDLSKVWSALRRVLLTEFPEKSPGRNPWRITDYISEFYRRELSYPGDKLNAVRGILRAFEKTDPPVHHILGIPLLSSIHIDVDAGPNRIPASTSLKLGLLWYHTSPGDRQPCFPSWTWAGWQRGTLSGSLGLDSSQYLNDATLRTSISLSNADGTTTYELQEFKEPPSGLQPRFLQIRSLVFECTIVQLPSEQRRNTFNIPVDSPYQIRFAVSEDRSTYAYSPLHLSRSTAPEEGTSFLGIIITRQSVAQSNQWRK